MNFWQTECRASDLSRRTNFGAPLLAVVSHFELSHPVPPCPPGPCRFERPSRCVPVCLYVCLRVCMYLWKLPNFWSCGHIDSIWLSVLACQSCFNTCVHDLFPMSSTSSTQSRSNDGFILLSAMLLPNSSRIPWPHFNQRNTGPTKHLIWSAMVRIWSSQIGQPDFYF